MDNARNFAKVLISGLYDTIATSVTLTTGGGAKLPTAPFNVVWWEPSTYPDPSDDPNVEIVRVTGIVGDTLTVVRAQEGTSATTKNTPGKTYQMIAGLTAKVMNTDLAALFVRDAANLNTPGLLPYISSSGILNQAAGLFWDSGSSQFGIGAAPTTGFGFDLTGSVALKAQSANPFGRAIVWQKRGRTGDATATPAAGSELGFFGFDGWNGTVYNRTALVIAEATENWTAIANGTQLSFYVTPTGSATRVLSHLIEQSGRSIYGEFSPLGAVQVRGGTAQGSVPGFEVASFDGIMSIWSADFTGIVRSLAAAAPATPSAGYGAIYVDSTSKNLAVKDDAGVVKHGVQTKAGVSNSFVTAIDDAGAVTVAQPSAANLSNGVTGSGPVVLQTSPTLASPIITNIAPGADFTLTQNSVAPFASVNIGAVNHTIYLNAGQVQFNAYGAGTLTTDASGNITAASDERLKDVLSPFERGLAAIQALDPIVYRWKPESGMDLTHDYVGFGAQHVQEVIPEAIGLDQRGYLTLADRPLLAAMVNAIKELSARIIELEKKK